MHLMRVVTEGSPIGFLTKIPNAFGAAGLGMKVFLATCRYASEVYKHRNTPVFVQIMCTYGSSLTLLGQRVPQNVSKQCSQDTSPH